MQYWSVSASSETLAIKGSRGIYNYLLPFNHRLGDNLRPFSESLGLARAAQLLHVTFVALLVASAMHASSRAPMARSTHACAMTFEVCSTR